MLSINPLNQFFKPGVCPLFRNVFLKGSIAMLQPASFRKQPYSTMLNKSSYLFSYILGGSYRFGLGNCLMSGKQLRSISTNFENSVKPLSSVKTVQWMEKIRAAKGMICFEEMKDPTNFLVRENVDHFIAALRQMPNEILFVTLPDHPTAYFLQQLFQFASDQGMPTLPELNMISRDQAVITRMGDDPETHVYDFSQQALDFKELEKLQALIGSRDNVDFNNVPLTTESTQFFSQFCLKFTKGRHFLVFNFKSFDEIIKVRFKEELK